MTAKVFLKYQQSGSALGRHPWIYEQQIEKIDGHPADGADLQIYRSDGRFIGRGYYNSQGFIRIRLMRFDDLPLDQAYIRGRIQDAIKSRIASGLTDKTRACRLIFSESDGLSGLTVDQYGPFLSMEINSLAFHFQRDWIVSEIARLTSAKGIWLQETNDHAKKEGIISQSGWIFGDEPEQEISFTENDIHWMVDFSSGQKTGFFLDQRDSRAWISSQSTDKDCLDLCCYTGGFSLSMAKGGARSVLGVDSSAAAITQAEVNAKKNQLSEQCQFFNSDLFDWLKSQNKKYDLIVLDPPRLAPSRKHREAALKKYYSMNEAALKALKPGGMIASFSCSSTISRQDLQDVMAGAARRLGYGLQMVHLFSQPEDHPISLHCPETEYLKGMACRLML